jgi:hypothetical protein
MVSVNAISVKWKKIISPPLPRRNRTINDGQITVPWLYRHQPTPDFANIPPVRAMLAQPSWRHFGSVQYFQDEFAVFLPHGQISIRFKDTALCLYFFVVKLRPSSLAAMYIPGSTQ